MTRSLQFPEGESMPPRGESRIVAVRLPRELDRLVRRGARKAGRSISSYLRLALQAYVKPDGRS